MNTAEILNSTEINPMPRFDENQQWRAVVDRDASQDGKFVFAVSSTGVYCRPSCSARRPRRENVTFFRKTDEAERAGYRACLRCRPLGISPKAYADSCRMNQLKSNLRAGHSVTRAMYDAGYSSSSRLYERTASEMGMTPDKYRRGAIAAPIRYTLR